MKKSCLLLIVICLHACSVQNSVHDRKYEYLESKSQQPLKFPQGQQVFNAGDYYDIPDGEINQNPNLVTFLPPDINLNPEETKKTI